MDVTLAVTADYANVTADGKLNILGVFGEVNPTDLPMILPQFYLVVTFDAGPAEFDTDKDIKIVLMDSDGNRFMELETRVQVPRPPRPGSRALINQIIGLAGVPFMRAGDYSFAVLVGGETKRMVPLYVNEPQPRTTT